MTIADMPPFVWFVIGAFSLFGVVLGGVSLFTRERGN
jgi:hypothetical protein